MKIWTAANLFTEQLRRRLPRETSIRLRYEDLIAQPHVELRRIGDLAEEILANHQRGHIPLKSGIAHPPEVKLPGEFKTMDVDLNAVGAKIGQRLLDMHERFN